MDAQALKQKALDSGDWDTERADWVFPDGSSVGKTYNPSYIQHHGHLAVTAGLVEYLDPFHGGTDEYWQAVNSLSKNFGIARACGSYMFQVWDRSGFKSIVKYLEKRGRVNSPFEVELVSEGKKAEVDSLEAVNYEISRAFRNTGLPGYPLYQVGLHEGIEAQLNA